jgi:hypothetical protein
MHYHAGSAHEVQILYHVSAKSKFAKMSRCRLFLLSSGNLEGPFPREAGGAADLVQLSVRNQEAKYVESWPSTTSAWAGWSRFDILVDRSYGVHSQLICTSITLGSSTVSATGLASRKILTEQNIKKWPSLYVLCGTESKLYTCVWCWYVQCTLYTVNV